MSHFEGIQFKNPKEELKFLRDIKKQQAEMLELEKLRAEIYAKTDFQKAQDGMIRIGEDMIKGSKLGAFTSLEGAIGAIVSGAVELSHLGKVLDPLKLVGAEFSKETVGTSMALQKEMLELVQNEAVIDGVDTLARLFNLIIKTAGEDAFDKLEFFLTMIGDIGDAASKFSTDNSEFATRIKSFVEGWSDLANIAFTMFNPAGALYTFFDDLKSFYNDIKEGEKIGVILNNLITNIADTVNDAIGNVLGAFSERWRETFENLLISLDAKLEKWGIDIIDQQEIIDERLARRLAAMDGILQSNPQGGQGQQSAYELMDYNGLGADEL